MIVNNVVFAVSSGKPATATGAGTPAVLYALDAMTGKDLWNSGTAIGRSCRARALWTSNSQVYVGGNDGAVYASRIRTRSSVDAGIDSPGFEYRSARVGAPSWQVRLRLPGLRQGCSDGALGETGLRLSVTRARVAGLRGWPLRPASRSSAKPSEAAWRRQ